jgi:hypothetical protein
LRCHESPLYKVRYEDRSLGIEDDLPVKPKTRYSEEGSFSMSKMTANTFSMTEDAGILMCRRKNLGIITVEALLHTRQGIIRIYARPPTHTKSKILVLSSAFSTFPLT